MTTAPAPTGAAGIAEFRQRVSEADLAASNTLPSSALSSLVVAGMRAALGGTSMVPVTPARLQGPRLWLLLEKLQTGSPFIEGIPMNDLVVFELVDYQGAVPAQPTREANLSQTWAPTSADLVRRLRADSGLTWEQLAKLFGVSRRAVHLWANGGRMNAANIEHLSRLLDLLAAEHSGLTSEQRRAALLGPQASGRSRFDELRGAHASGDGDVSGTPWPPRALLEARRAPESP